MSATTSLQERATGYNIEVDAAHTYFVGENRAWVHNASGRNCPCGAKGGSKALPDIPKDATVRVLKPDPNRGAK